MIKISPILRDNKKLKIIVCSAIISDTDKRHRRQTLQPLITWKGISENLFMNAYTKINVINDIKMKLA